MAGDKINRVPILRVFWDGFPKLEDENKIVLVKPLVPAKHNPPFKIIPAVLVPVPLVGIAVVFVDVITPAVFKEPAYKLPDMPIPPKLVNAPELVLVALVALVEVMIPLVVIGPIEKTSVIFNKLIGPS